MRKATAGGVGICQGLQKRKGTLALSGIPGSGKPLRRRGYSPLASWTSRSSRATSVILRLLPSRRNRPVEPSRLSSRETASRCVLMRSAMSARKAPATAKLAPAADLTRPLAEAAPRGFGTEP
jgi:hypothetical protein